MSSITRRDLWIVLAALGLGLLYVASAGGGFPLDDSWIHQTYARNLAQFGEWSFTPSIPSTASTSPLYTVVLAVGYRLGIPYAIWTHGLGIAALALAGLIGARLAEILIPDVKRAGLWAGLGVVSAWHLIWAAGAGMETMLFSMLVLLTILMAWRELRPNTQSAAAFSMRGAVFGVSAGLLTLARPEGLLLVGLLGLALLVTRPNMSWGQLLLYGASALFTYALLLWPYLSFNLQVTGGLLPNTAASKRADLVLLFERPYLVRVLDLLTPLSAGVQVMLIPGVAVLLWDRLRGLKRQPSLLLHLVPLAWSAGLVLLYAAYLPAFFQHGRYVIPALPTFIVCGVAGTLLLTRRRPQRMLERVLVRTLVSSTIVYACLMALLVGRDAYRRDVEIIDSEMVPAAHWIQANIAPDGLMAIHDIGAVGYFAPRPILDLAGLVSPELLPVIPVEDNGPAVWDILKARDVRYVMGFVDQLPGANPDDPRLCPVFRSRGEDAEVSVVYNMSIYRIAWDQNCEVMPSRGRASTH